MSFGISCSAPKPLKLPYDFWKDVMAVNAEMKELGIPLHVAVKKWNDSIFTTELGNHPGQNIYDEPVLVDNGYGDYVPVDLTVGLFIQQQLFFGHTPIPKLSGFKDELSGKIIIANAFNVGLLSPEEVVKTWKPIQTMEDVPVDAVLRVTGLVAWDAESGETFT